MLLDIDMIKKLIFLLTVYINICIFSPQILASSARWLDLPKEDYCRVLNLPNETKAMEITSLISKYSNLDKTKIDLLPSRINSLLEVSNYIDEWIKTEKREHIIVLLNNLKKISDNKRSYLIDLNDCYKNNKFEDNYLEKTLNNIDKLKNNRVPLFLLNERRYHTKYAEYWGEYWLEAMDPCHRQLMTYRDRWILEKEKNPNLPHLFMWLETQNLSKDVPYLDYMTNKELQESTVKIQDGKLYFINGNRKELVGNKIPVEYLFIIDLDENLIVAKGSKLIHHNSLSHSKPVLGAGKMIVKNGVLQMISFESGHYIPTKIDARRVIEILKDKGVFFVE